MKSLRFIALYAAISLVIACGAGVGGGSNDSNGGNEDESNNVEQISYQGLTSQAVVTTSNVTYIGVGALQGGYTGASYSSLGGAVKNIQIASFRPRALNLVQLLSPPVLKMISMTLPSYSIKSSSSVIQDDSRTDYGDCGGTVNYTINLNETTGDFYGTQIYNKYCSQGITVSGNIILSGKADPSSLSIILVTISFNPINTTYNSDTSIIQGTIDYDFTASPLTATMNLLLRCSCDGNVFKYDNLRMTFTDGGNYTEFTMDGRFYYPNYGYVEISTGSPFRIYYYNPWPSFGNLMFRGSSGTMGLLNINSSSEYSVEVDTNGDGYCDWSRIISWYEEPGSGGRPDLISPGAPTGLAANIISDNEINLSWSAPSDNVRVAGYKIYRNGHYLKSESNTLASDTGINTAIQYCYTVSAYDTAENESQQSTKACNSGITQLSISPSTMWLAPGLNQQMSAYAVLGDRTPWVSYTDMVNWTVQDPSIAEINSKGLLSSLKAGTTNITASYDILNTSVSVTVRPIKFLDQSDVGMLYPKVGINDSGDIIAAWVHRFTKQIFVTSYSASLGWNQVNEISQGVINAYPGNIAVDINNKGDKIIVIESDSAIYAAVARAGQNFTAPLKLADKNTSGIYTKMDESGNAIAVWADRGLIYSSRYNYSADVWSNPDYIVDSNTSEGRLLGFAGNNIGDVIAIWSNVTDNKTALYASINLFGIGNISGWQPSRQLYTNILYYWYDTSVAINNKGEVMVAWKTSMPPNGNEALYTESYSPDKGWSNYDILPIGSSKLIYTPSISINQNGEAILVWADSINHELYANRYVKASGWSNSEYLGYGGDMDYIRPFINDQSHIFVFSDNKIWRYLPSGGWQIPSFLDYMKTIYYHTVDMAFNSKGNGVIGWQESSGSDARNFLSTDINY